MLGLLTRWIWVSCLFLSTVTTAQPVPPLEVEGGLVQGFSDAGITIYKGIPFAAPPIGNLRWRPPQPLQKWEGIITAGNFKPACEQVIRLGKPLSISEDCLYLNIWAPSEPVKSKLPVMVWIHGGSFVAGSASDPLYWGEKLAIRGVIVVNISYRLGVFGFLAHPELTKESENNVSGNYALMDMIAALRWIRKNIALFGGNPDQVTLFGESMGSRAVNLLMASPLARGLFHRAIGQSGGFFAPSRTKYGVPYLVSAEADGQSILAELGVRSIAEMRQLPPARLARLEKVFTPVIDGYVIPDEVYSVFAAGRQNDIPILVGYNDNEGANLIESLVASSEFIKRIRDGNSSNDFMRQILALYPAKTDEQAWKSQLRIKRDMTFGWDMWTWARMQSSNGKGKVFLYYFAHKPPYPVNSQAVNWGAAHGAEMFYMFDHLNQYPDWNWTPEDRLLAETMISFWVNFAKSGDPNGKGLPTWPAFNARKQITMCFDKVVSNCSLPNRLALEFWEREAARIRKKTQH